MAAKGARPGEPRGGMSGATHVVLADSWTWLGVGALWGSLLGAATWLVTEPPTRWTASLAAAALGIVAGRVAVVRETLSLEGDDLVSRVGSRTVRLPLAAVDRIETRFEPKTGWVLHVRAAQTEIALWPEGMARDLCRELGRRLEPRRAWIRVQPRAGAWLGWAPEPTHDEVAAHLHRRHQVVVLLGPAEPLAVHRVVLAALGDAVIQVLVGGRMIAREDSEGWRAFVEGLPWPDRVELRGTGRDPLAVLEPGGTTVGARLTGPEQRELEAALPTGCQVVPVRPPLAQRAGRGLAGWLERLVG